MQEFVIAIPSYKRAGAQRTLDYLSRIGIKKERIFIFVQTEQDLADYQIHADRSNIIYAPASGIAKARNNILNELSEQYNVLMLDDDVRAIGELKGENIKMIDNAQAMDELFSKCFEMCGKTGISIFGIYPVFNAFFMERSISTLSPINTVFGFTKGFKLRYDESYDTKEDAELCAKILSFGKKILRFNFITVDADHRKTKHGYIDDWHQEENVRCVKKLVSNYPKIYKPQKNKPWEIRTLIKDSKIHLDKKGGTAK